MPQRRIPARSMLCRLALMGIVALSPAAASAGGLLPTTLPPLDPDLAAHFVVRDSAPDAGLQLFAAGGRFGGDLDGDGADDIVLQAAEDEELEIWFGDPTWGSEGQDDDNATGDTTLRLPEGCLQADARVHYAALGDLDGDGFDDLGVACADAPGGGGFAVYFGHPQSWGGSVSDPDVFVPGGGGDTAGAEIAGVGDLDGDGFDDFVVSGRRGTGEVPLAWIFNGSADIDTDLSAMDDATWTLAGHDTLRCLEPLLVTTWGDFDGDGLSDLAVSCPEQPDPNPLNPDEDNVLDIALSVFVGASLMAAPAGDLQFVDRDFAWAAGIQRVPRAIPFAALGDIDGDGFGDAAIVSWFPAGASLSAQVLAGYAAPFEDIALTTPYTPFLPGVDYLHPEGVQLAPAGPFPASDAAVWIRWGSGDDAAVGLLADYDPAEWEGLEEPPVRVRFTTPGGADQALDWRLGLGGPGDADGDGVPDLLILGGFEDDDGCTADTCGGAWLVLCGDLDDDGVSACAGDCDDADPSISPAITEQCDAIDHDCDGADGQLDADGDGQLGCEGDCDDADPAQFAGANETCDSPGDLDCDGLSPLGDVDEDGSINCEDCQPWNGALYPGADEVCDGLDTDCDGELPAEEQDIDQDGWRGCSVGGSETDCDDLDPWVHPFRFEDCSNEIDDDCNGSVDEDRDEDADGVRTCDGDCRDSDATVFPGAGEECDGLDNNCNGVIDDARDFDSDGYSVCQGDCDNHDAAVHPGATGVCEAGLDSNCDGLDDLFDADADGFTACSGDCDDADPGVAPTGQDWCDRADNDCDGAPDAPWDLDLDGWADCLGDCADGDSERFPQVVEPDCTDSVDADCDGAPDLVDTDCPPVDNTPPLGPRPYGLACDDCSGSVSGGAATPAVLLVGLLLLGRRRRRTGHQRVATVALAAMVLLPATADAARKQEAMLIYLSPQPDLTSMVAARDLAAATGFTPEEVLHTSELLEDEDADTLMVLDSRVTWECAEGGIPPVLGDAVDRSLEALINLDHEAALGILDDAIDGLPCIASPLPPRVLENLFYYRGVAQFSAGDPVGADEDFRRALAVEPDYPGDPNFPPEIGEAFEVQRAAVAATPAIPIIAYVPGSTTVRLDGSSWDAQAGEATLQPGLHVIQYRRGRFLWTSVVELIPDTRPVVIHTGDQVRALKDCVLDPAARAFTAATLALATADAGLEIAGLIDLYSGEELRWLYRPEDDAFSFEEKWMVEKSRGGAKARRGGGRTGGSGSARTGGGRAGGGRSGGGTGGRSGGGTSAGATVTPSDWSGDRARVRVSGGFNYVHPFPYVQIPLDFGVRIVSGLFVDIGVEVGIAGPSDHGTVLLPSASGGLSWRFDVGVFQPRIGAVGRIALDSSPTEGESVGFKGGWAGRLGFDVVPPGAFLFGLDVQGGMLGRYGQVGIHAGVGLRF